MKKMDIIKEIREFACIMQKVEVLTCHCGGHFIHPKHIWFDSDGSILICDNDNVKGSGQPCTNWVLKSKILKRFEEIDKEGLKRWVKNG